jgi:DNA-directed RNA polymerase subunit L
MQIKVNVIEDESKSFVAELVGADRSFVDLIKEKLSENKDVEFSSVEKDHPETGDPRLIVKSSKNARGLVLKAIESLEDDLKELEGEIPKK